MSDSHQLFDAAFSQRQGIDLELVETARAVSVMYRLKDDIVISRGRGHVDAPHILHMIQYCETVLAHAPTIRVFHDWFGVTGYESKARQVITPWAIRTRDRHRAIHIGVTSQVVRMGVSVVALASRAPIHTYGSHHTLGVALAEALRPATGRPPSA